jgi:uridine kinase
MSRNNEFSKWLQTCLKKRDLTQSKLASLIGVKQDYISNLISGKNTNPSLRLLERLSTVFEEDYRTVCELIGMDPEHGKERPVLIGVSGASGSGKTWFTEKLRTVNPDLLCVISLDNYYKEASFVKTLEFKYDNPQAIDHNSAYKDLCILGTGNPKEIPVYDYKEHKTTKHIVVHPKPIIIFEGHLLFHNPQIRNKLDVKIWIEARNDTRLESVLRRIRRDIKSRKRDTKDIIETYKQEVMPAYDEHIHHLKEYADLVIPNNRDIEPSVPMGAKAVIALAKEFSFYSARFS